MSDRGDRLSANNFPCPTCDQPTKDGLMCARDTARVRHTIRELPDIARDLTIARTRQSRLGHSGGGGGSRGSDFVGPVPWDERAATAGKQLAGTIGEWLVEFAAPSEVTRIPICECTIPEEPCGLLERVEFTPAGTPGRTMTAWSVWLLARLPAVRRHKHVNRFVEELDHAVKQARRAVDRPVDLEYVCLCAACGSEVYAPKGADIATCKACRALVPRDDDGNPDEDALAAVPTYDVASEHLRRIDAVKSSLLPRDDLGTAIGMSWAPVNRKTITSWINRGRLPVRGCRTTDRAELFYVGDALDLAAQIPAKPEPAPESVAPPQIPRRRRTRGGQPA